MNACCGLNCAKCPTYLATQKNDDTARKKVAEQWSKFFGMALCADDINCEGCLSGSSKMFAYCRQCNIRSCCEEKRFATCAECGDYPCQNLNGFFTLMPDAKKGLEEIRRNLSPK